MFIKRYKHLPDCPRENDKQFNANSDECDSCEMLIEEVPIKEALRHIAKIIGKDWDDDDLTDYVRRHNAPHN